MINNLKFYSNKRLLSSLSLGLMAVVVAIPIGARDFDFTYAGQTVTYTVIDEEAKTCRTKSGQYGDYGFIPGSNIAGSLTLPSNPNDGESDYTLIEIGSLSFVNSEELTSVEIPATVTIIENNAFSVIGEGKSKLTSVKIPNSVETINLSFCNCTELRSVELPTSVTKIYRAFEGCTGLTFVKIPASVTHIGGAFVGCTGLTTVEIPASVTHISRAFEGCTGLTTVEIPNSVTEMWSAFEGCTGLTSVKIPNSVTNIREAFRGCTGLTTVEIPASVTEMWSAFEGCTGLTSINIPSSVTDISNAFRGCTGLTSVEIPNSVTEMRSAFEGCTGLTSVKIPNSVTNIGEAFRGCTGLTTVEIPASVTEMWSAFEGCTGLTSINIPSSVTDMSGAFEGCTNLARLEFASEEQFFELCGCLTGLGAELEIYANEVKIQIDSIKIPNTIETIKDSQFYGLNWLKSVTIPKTVSIIGDNAFASCSNLREVIFEDGDYDPNHDIYNFLSTGKTVFEGCPIESVYLGRSISISSSDRLFENLTTLTDLKIGDKVVCLSGNYMFKGCTGLKSVVFPESFSSHDPFYGSNIFSGCTGLTSVVIPNSCKEIRYNSTFSGCTNLKSVTLGNLMEKIAKNTFNKCGNIVKVALPNTIEWLWGGEQFLYDPAEGMATPDGCIYSLDGKTLMFVPANVTDFVIPEGVTTIESNAFSLCELKTLSIPSTIESVKADAFARCSIERVDIADWSKWYTNARLENLWSNPYCATGEAYAGGVKISLHAADLKTGVTAINDYVNAGLTYDAGEIELPSSLKRIGKYAFYKNSELYSIMMNEGLEEIGESAFEGCELLESHKFPSTLTKIEDNAYKGAKKLTEVTLPIALTELGSGVFEGCSALEKSVMVSDVHDLGENLFKDCHALNKLFLPLELKSIGKQAFEGCVSLDGLTLPASLQTIGERAFAEGSLTKLVIPDNVSSIGKEAFKNQKLAILSFGQGIETIPSECFAGNLLKEISFAEGLKSIESNAFADNPAILSVILPASLTSIAQDAFINTSICELSIPDAIAELPAGSCGNPSILTIGSGVQTIAADAFGFDNLHVIRLKSNMPPTLSDALAMTDAQNDALTLIVNNGRRNSYVSNARWKQIDNIIEESTSDIVIYMTGDLSISQEIRSTTGLMPSNVTKMKVVGPLTEQDLRIISENMTSLISLDLSEAEDIIAIPDNQFSGSLLIEVKLPASLESIGANAFANASLLQIEELPDGVTSIGDGAFSNTPRISISQLPSKLTTIGEKAFENCSGLRSISASELLEVIGKGVFSGCLMLESVDLSKTALKSIPDYAFNGCTELDEIAIPESVEALGANSFNSTAISNINFAAKVSSIGKYAFSNCQRLVVAEIPAGVNLVSEGLFANCPRLIAITMSSATEALASNIVAENKKVANISCAALNAPTAEIGAFNGLRMRYVSLTVPTKSFREYLDAAQWGRFQSIQNRIPVTIDPGVKVSIVAEAEYQEMLAEDALEAATDAAAQTTPARNARRISARAAAADGRSFAALFDGAQIQTGNDEASAIRIFVNPDEDVNVVSILFNGEEMIGKLEGNSLLLPLGANGSLYIMTDAEKETPKNPSMVVSPESVILTEGESAILTAELLDMPEDVVVVWTSSNEAVATVDAQGVVTAISEGTATISVSCNGLTAEISVLVNAKSETPDPNEGDDEDAIAVVSSESDIEVFDLKGVKIGNSLEGLHKGVYIVRSGNNTLKIVI